MQMACKRTACKSIPRLKKYTLYLKDGDETVWVTDARNVFLQMEGYAVSVNVRFYSALDFTVCLHNLGRDITFDRIVIEEKHGGLEWKSRNRIYLKNGAKFIFSARTRYGTYTTKLVWQVS